MGAVADGKVVIACVQNVGLGGSAVIAGKVLHVRGNFHGLRSSRFQRVGLAKAHQLHSGFFHAVLLVVVGVGGLRIDLHNVLACHITRVGDGDRGRYGLRIFIHVYAVQRLAESRIGQAIAKTIADFGSIVPAAVAGEAAGFRAGVALTQYSIFIAGLIVTIAKINVFSLNQIVTAEVVQTFALRIGKGEISTVLGSGRRSGIHCVSIRQMTRWRYRTIQHIHQAISAVGAQLADPEDRVNIRVLLQAVDFDSRRRVDNDDHLIKIGFSLINQSPLFGRDCQRAGG